MTEYFSELHGENFKCIVKDNQLESVIFDSGAMYSWQEINTVKENNVSNPCKTQIHDIKKAFAMATPQKENHVKIIGDYNDE